MIWLILSVSAICSGSFGGYGDGGKISLSVGTRGTTLGGDRFHCSITFGSARVLPPGRDPGCYVTFRDACSVGEGGMGCSVGAAIEVSVTCSYGGDGFGCYVAALVLKISANCSTSVLALGPYY